MTEPGTTAMDIALVAALLLYEHLIVSPTDLSRLNAAFFTMNGVIAMVFFLSVATDVFFRHAHTLHAGF